MQKLDLKIYRINKLGYYSRRTGPENIDDISDILTNLKTWIGNQKIVQNCTYAGTDVPGSQKTLCVSVLKNSTNADFLLTLWAGIDVGDKNSVGAMTSAANPENVDVEENEFSDGAVPGYPIYFWVIPELNVLTPVRVDGSKNGIVNFSRYINGFVDRFSKFCKCKADEDGKRSIDYYGAKESDRDGGYYPMFAYKNWQNKNIAQYLRDNREKIEKIIRKDLIIRAADKSLAKRCFNLGSNDDDRLTGVSFKCEVEITPSAGELNEMIFQVEAEPDGDLEFGYKIGSETHWLGHSIQKERFSARLLKTGGILYRPSSLMTALQEFRHVVIDNLTEE